MLHTVLCSRARRVCHGGQNRAFLQPSPLGQSGAKKPWTSSPLPARGCPALGGCRQLCCFFNPFALWRNPWRSGLQALYASPGCLPKNWLIGRISKQIPSKWVVHVDNRMAFSSSMVCGKSTTDPRPLLPSVSQAVCAVLKELGDPNAQSAACVIS